MPGCDGIILGGHGLFTWGDTQHACYVSSVTTIDQMGVHRGAPAAVEPRAASAGRRSPRIADRRRRTASPSSRISSRTIRGAVSTNCRVIGHVDSSEDALTFANSKAAEELRGLGTSCPDHFLRTRISPMFVAWDPATENAATICGRIDERIARYREDYAAYYKSFAEPARWRCATRTPPSSSFRPRLVRLR